MLGLPLRLCYDLQHASCSASPNCIVSLAPVAGGLLCGVLSKVFACLQQFVQRLSSSTADCEKLDVSCGLECHYLQPPVPG